jgi:3-oxoacyl-[acyl-carrier-protein] synthase-3
MDMLTGVAISGVGHCLPEDIETNTQLCIGLPVSPDWVVEKTGIKQRRIARKGDTASDYAIRSGKMALSMANIAPEDVDLIIVCTFSGDYIFPPVSAKVQKEIGATNAQIFDLQANCTGFLTGLTVASDRMKADISVRNALIIGVEFLSRYISRVDVNTSIYLSDGAGAAVLSRTDVKYGILSSAFFTDSSNYEAVRLRGGGSSFSFKDRSFLPEVDLIEMNGVATWKQAITHLPKTIKRACEKANIELGSIDFLLFHQANLRLIEYLVRKLGFDMTRTYTNIELIGNTGAASLAIAMSEATQRGHLKNGDLVVLAAVGAGFNFGASVWRWRL